MPVRLRHAGRGLVEQQDARPAGDRERDLQEPLLAVGQRGGALVYRIGEAEALDEIGDLVDDLRLGPGGAPPVRAGAEALGDDEAERFHRREIRKQLVDLKRAGNAQPVDSIGRKIADRPAAE